MRPILACFALPLLFVVPSNAQKSWGQAINPQLDPAKSVVVSKLPSRDAVFNLKVIYRTDRFRDTKLASTVPIKWVCKTVKIIDLNGVEHDPVSYKYSINGGDIINRYGLIDGEIMGAGRLRVCEASVKAYTNFTFRFDPYDPRYPNKKLNYNPMHLVTPFGCNNKKIGSCQVIMMSDRVIETKGVVGTSL